MKLFSLLPKRLVHFACNSPEGAAGGRKKNPSKGLVFGKTFAILPLQRTRKSGEQPEREGFP